MFLQNRIQRPIAFPTMPLSTPCHLSLAYLCSEQSPPLASPGPPDPIFGIGIRFRSKFAGFLQKVLRTDFRPGRKNAGGVLRPVGTRPPFFSGSTGRLPGIDGYRRDLHVGGWRGPRTCRQPPRIGPKSSLSGSDVLSRAQTAGRNDSILTHVKPEANLNEVRGVHTPGGVGKGENSTLWLTRRGSRDNLCKLTLAPPSSPRGPSSFQRWRRAHETRVRQRRPKRRFRTLSGSASEGCPGRKFGSGGGEIWRTYRGWEEL